jgi:hypothetical protein
MRVAIRGVEKQERLIRRTDLDVPLGVQENVVGLDVTVDNGLIM